MIFRPLLLNWRVTWWKNDQIGDLVKMAKYLVMLIMLTKTKRASVLLMMFKSHLDRGLLLFLASQVPGKIFVAAISVFVYIILYLNLCMSRCFLLLNICDFVTLCVCLFVYRLCSTITWQLAKCTPPLEAPLTLLPQETTHSRSSFAPLSPFKMSNWSWYWCRWTKEEQIWVSIVYTD